MRNFGLVIFLCSCLVGLVGINLVAAHRDRGTVSLVALAMIFAKAAGTTAKEVAKPIAAALRAGG